MGLAIIGANEPDQRWVFWPLVKRGKLHAK